MENQQKPFKIGWKKKIEVNISLTPKIEIESIILFLRYRFFLIMERFLFVLGSNWKLSIAELDNYLNYSQNKGKIIDYSANIAIVEFENLHQDRHYINKLMEIQFTLGGCQKIAKIYDFIDKVYKDYYEQVKSYANDVKLAVMIVVDSREVTRNKNPDMVKDCYEFKVNKRDGVFTAIFVIQASDKRPSQRK